MANLFWTPKDHRIGDITIIRVGDEYHLFTEQAPVDWQGGMGDTFAGIRSVGHAVGSASGCSGVSAPPRIAGAAAGETASTCGAACGSGPAISSSVSTETPRNVMSNFDHVVTQWIAPS